MGSERLTVSDFCRLDSALSDLALRAWLRSSLESSHPCDQSLNLKTKSPKIDEYLGWILKDNQKLKSIGINNTKHDRRDDIWRMVIDIWQLRVIHCDL